MQSDRLHTFVALSMRSTRTQQCLSKAHVQLPRHCLGLYRNPRLRVVQPRSERTDSSEKVLRDCSGKLAAAASPMTLCAVGTLHIGGVKLQLFREQPRRCPLPY